MSEQVVKLRCQRIGCDATFSTDDNPEGSCRYHDAPLFHDGMKEWSCCKKRSHDFSLFLEIPGCKTGKHTTEKPVLTNAAPSPRIPTSAPTLVPGPSTGASSKETCSRCKQGFFCSDHGIPLETPIILWSCPVAVACSLPNPKPVDSQAAASAEVTVSVSASPKRIVGINEPQVCKNKGCGQTFKKKDNHDTACDYHPGPAIFHDRMRGWKCCDVHVKEFDEFMSIPPCTKGWHNADPTS